MSRPRENGRKGRVSQKRRVRKQEKVEEQRAEQPSSVRLARLESGRDTM